MPSPTAAPSWRSEYWRTSPAANTPSTLVRICRSVTTWPALSSSTTPRMNSLLGWKPM